VIPPNGTIDRYLVQQALSFIGTEYHKTVGNLFNPTLDPSTRAFFVHTANTKLTYMNESLLRGRDYLVGEKLSVADIYLFICLSWCPYVGLDLSGYPVVQTYFKHIGNLPDVLAAQEAMTSNPTHT
jgi:glutathione S-transferase